MNYLKNTMLLFAALSMLTNAKAFAVIEIPSNAEPTCEVPKDILGGWFHDGELSKGGVVKPADALEEIFHPSQDNTLCDFYKWGAQMFLWLASPQGNSFVFDGPDFYDVKRSEQGLILQANTLTALNNSFNTRALKEDPIDSTGQAGGGGVLISQQGSLTYYGMSVNNVFAQYRTGHAAGKFKNTAIENVFPNTQEGLMLVEKFAGTRLSNGEALAMEVKTSWVDANTVTDPSRHILINASVPQYKKISDTRWELQDEPQSKLLALVGMHVVGAVNGHPEMVWATFEHVDNAPQLGFYYNNRNGRVSSRSFDSNGKWIFAERNLPETATINETQVVASSRTRCVKDKTCSAGDIVATDGNLIGKNNVVRTDPWGSEPKDTQDIRKTNTYLISLNHSILPILQSLGDPRGNYFQVGSVWTVDGSIPDGPLGDELRGALSIANATMETFHQRSAVNEGSNQVNCFGCHKKASPDGIQPPKDSFNISHIFSDILPLE